MYVQVLHTYIHTRSPRLGKQSRHLKNCEIILYLLPLRPLSYGTVCVYVHVCVYVVLCLCAQLYVCFK